MCETQSDLNARDESVAHTYSFYANSFLVNEQIYAEAKETLYRDNRFFKISYQWPSLGSSIHGYDVPIVTENQQAVGSFTEHSIRLHLQHHLKKSQLPEQDRTNKDFLMLLQGMDAFGTCISWISLKGTKPVTIFLK